jgi:hypothetical protein
MLHTVSGHNFHGRYSIRLCGSAEGFALSPAQARKVRNALCGMSDCTCRGGYGDGPDRDSAWIEGEPGALYLIPESEVCARRRADDRRRAEDFAALA